MTVTQEQNIPANIEIGAEDRYHRQRLIAWWKQESIQNARILVIGAGALGNEILKTLALIGVGNILIYDMDTIELSNLSRSILFDQENQGQYKSVVAAERVQAINPDVKAVGHGGNVIGMVGLGVFLWADVVICGLDNRLARMFVNRACAWTGRKWVDGAIEGLSGTVRAFDPKDDACYECTMGEADYRLIEEQLSCAMLAREIVSHGYVPNTAVAAGIVGAMQVQEAVKILHDQPALIGQGYRINGLWNDIGLVRFPRREDCTGHDYFGPFEPLGAGVADITLDELLTRAESKLGDDAVLDLSRDFIIRFECAACGEHSACGKVLGMVAESEATCPTCGAHRAPHFTSSISRDDDVDKSLTPAEIGVPLFDCIIARRGLDTWCGWYFDGDAPTVLKSLDIQSGSSQLSKQSEQEDNDGSRSP